MEIRVKLSNFRVAPRKSRLIVDLIRGKNVLEAQSLLLFTVNKSSKPVLKLLNSALAAAKNNYQLEKENLFISEITANEGPKLKRWHAMSRGRAFPIMKRSSHIVLVLSEKKSVTKVSAKGGSASGRKKTKVAKTKMEVNKETPKEKTADAKSFGELKEVSSKGESVREEKNKIKTTKVTT